VEPGRMDNKDAVFIPLSGKSFRLTRIISFILIALLIIYSLIIIFFLPAQLLLSISRGKSFTSRNVKYLRLMGWSFIGAYLLPVLSACIFDLIFRSDIPAGIYLSLPDVLMNNRGMLIAGLVLLLIAGAFSKGLELQNENDLSI
jgi:hypothetical protein